MRRPEPRLAAALFMLAGAAAAQDGAEIYARGTGLTARLGSAEGALLPAGRLTCAGCHGPDARGGSEGGLRPAPAIGWTTLSQPAADRPAYDGASFRRLLEQGVTPSGRAISGLMPRFSGPDAVLQSLQDHLAALDAAETLGLTPTGIAVALPASGSRRAAALAAMAAFNAEGGAYGRLLQEASPAFLDLDDIASTLAPRIRSAEAQRLAALLAEDNQLRPVSDRTAMRVAGTLDQIGPQLTSLLARKVKPTVVGPSPEALRWALSEHHDADASHSYAAIRAGLECLRSQGRLPGRSKVRAALKSIDVSAMISVYVAE